MNSPGHGGGMAGTTKEMFLGTSKNSTNIPGYMGFLPRSKTLLPGERADKETLIQTFRKELPGYTGYVAEAPNNVRFK